MTNQEKKSCLRRYRLLDEEIDRKLEELSRWRERAGKLSARVDGMPRGSSESDPMQDAVCQMVELSQQIDRDLESLTKLREEIKSAIDTVSDERLRLLLCYRYIDGLTFEQIAVRMNYNYRWVLRLHGMALTQLAIESHIDPVL